MITLQHFNGKSWVDCDTFHNEAIAWISLGDDNLNYRTIDEYENVLTDKSIKTQIPGELAPLKDLPVGTKYKYRLTDEGVFTIIEHDGIWVKTQRMCGRSSHDFAVTEVFPINPELKQSTTE